MLKHLVEDGLVIAEQDDKERKYYMLTKNGIELLLELDTAIKEFLRVIIDIKK